MVQATLNNMALSKEQFEELRKKGLSINQILSFESGQTPRQTQSDKNIKKHEENILQKAFGGITTGFEKASEFLFGSFGKTAGTLVGSLGEQTEKFTRPEELEQKIDPALQARLREQGLSEQEIKEKTLVKTEDAFKPEDITAGNIAFTALETLPGGGALTQTLKRIKGGERIAEGIETITKALPDKLKAQAVEQFKSVLGATTKKFKAISSKIAPELAERETLALSRAGLEKKATKLAAEEGKKIGEFIEQIPKTTKLKTKPLIDAIEETKKGFTVKGVVVEPEKLKVADEILDIVKQFGDELEANNVIKLRRIWDETIAKAGKGFTPDIKDTFRLEVKKVTTNKIRDELAKEFPDLAKINKEFAFWNNVKNTVGETLERTGGKMPFSERQAEIVGTGAGIIRSGIADAIIIGQAAKNFVKLTSSTAWKTLSAKSKMQLAEAIESGSAGKIAEVIKRLLVGIKNINE